MSKSRVYVVTDAGGHSSFVRAVSASQAVRYLSRHDYKVRVAKVDDVVAIDASDVEDATEEHDDV